MWAIDFQSDETADGRQLRFLNIVDEHTRQALVIRVVRSITADRTVQVLDDLISTLGRDTTCQERLKSAPPGVVPYAGETRFG